jgi:hypothetical protein
MLYSVSFMTVSGVEKAIDATCVGRPCIVGNTEADRNRPIVPGRFFT